MTESNVAPAQPSLPPWQQALQARCIHPTGAFARFPRSAIEQSIPERFEEQVRLYPDRIAVRSRRETLTYAGLNRAANRIAAAVLDRRGEEAEPVALLFEQGARAVTAILGVVKAGKCYVPLDPRHPPARIAATLASAGAALIVTDGEHSGLAAELFSPGGDVLDVEAIDLPATMENPGLSLSPDTLAYIFYTSGSTGAPKGVVDSHRNVLHNVMRYTNGLRIGVEDRLTLLQSPSFSGTVSSLFGALLNGASLFPVRLWEEPAEALAAWLAREEITIYHSVPALFRALLAGRQQFPRLRVIRLEGDQASRRDVALFQEKFGPDCLLVNGLGATETGLVRRYFIDRETPLPDGAVPIGYAVEDMEILVLDEAGERVADGSIGEIAVKSRFLALGYWRNPELTRARFLPDPDGGLERIYRTGDVGRMRPGGCLEYLGRKDFQAKVRGHAVEVAAVEAVLLGLGSIREAIVVTRTVGEEGGAAGGIAGEAAEEPSAAPEAEDTCLVAYLVPGDGPVPTVSALRRALAVKLPEQSIPSRFVMMEALPLTESGKIDRRALPEPGRVRPELDALFLAPRTPVEELLAALWADLLALDRVGVQDSFFELGGDSLLATRLLARAREIFQVDVPPRRFFDAPTVAGLATTLTTHEAAPGRVTAIARLRLQVDALSADEIQGMLQTRAKSLQ